MSEVVAHARVITIGARAMEVLGPATRATGVGDDIKALAVDI